MNYKSYDKKIQVYKFSDVTFKILIMKYAFQFTKYLGSTKNIFDCGL